MTDRPVRVRVAPSPTGDPHVGTAYQSLFDYAFARQQGGKWILRIEDTDRQRYIASSEQEIVDTLHWLGLDWDEGPDIGGQFGPYRQSERLPLYQEVAKRLLDEGHAYYCWCTPERLAAMRAEQQRLKQPTGYDRFCLGKTYAERQNEPGCSDTPVVRMLIPDNASLSFTDVIRGETNAPRPDDQVILKADGFPTYHLAVVVDDHAMEISHVTRGEEWISSTPKHLLLYEWLGWEPPAFAHFPLLRNTDHSKISKRKNPAARLLWFKEQGFLPEALLNFLALMGWSMPDEREVFTLDDLVRSFTWTRFSPVGPVFDIDKLDWLNGQYIQRLPMDRFLKRAAPFLPRPGQETALRVLATDLQERTKRLSELPEQVDFLYVDEIETNAELLLKQGFDAPTAFEALECAEQLVLSTEPFEAAALEESFQAEREQRGWKARTFFMTVRVAATGKTVTPPLFRTMEALGRERVARRMRASSASVR